MKDCKKCGGICDEEYQFCDACADEVVERSNAQKEWNYYHPQISLKSEETK
jgi:uncharacterized membrane protein YvbJ